VAEGTFTLVSVMETVEDLLAGPDAALEVPAD
jgi:hypothetical protein